MPVDGLDHGRVETRRIWVSTALNEYLDFPHVGLIFKVERTTCHKKSKRETCDVAYGITSKTPAQCQRSTPR